MKFAILIVTFALTLYCGLFMSIYSVNYKTTYNVPPMNIGELTQDKLYAEMNVKTYIGKVEKQITTTTSKQEIFGFEIGKPVTVHYYLLKLTKSDSNKHYYSVLSTSDEEHISAIENGKNGLVITGSIQEMPLNLSQAVMHTLSTNPEIIQDDFPYTTTSTLNMFISDYYIADIKPAEEWEYNLPIIIGGILSAVGGCGLVILIVKKVKHNAY